MIPIGVEEMIKQIKLSKFTFHPLIILQVENSGDAREGFKKKILSPQITVRIAATLAFDQISTKEANRYVEDKNQKGYYRLNMERYGLYEAALISDIQYLKSYIRLKNQEQEHKRTLLYSCCRSGYYDCIEYLLELGCNIDQQRNTNSTPLHVASYYGHEKVIGLLISYGANDNAKNIYGNRPSDEARTDSIKQQITNCSDHTILKFFQELKVDNLVDCIQRSKNDNMIRIYRKVKGVDVKKLYKNKTQYSHCYHGTQYKSLKPILDVGLQPTGAQTKYGKIETPNGHIQQDATVDGIKNWGRTIFTSPSPFYAADIVYSGRIICQNQQYCCLVEALIKNGGYSEYTSRILIRDFEIPNEPQNVEYRIDCNQDELLIQRTEDASKVIVFSALFLREQYLQDQKNYNECKNFLDNCSAFQI